MTGVSCGVLSEKPIAVGRSFTGLTVMVTGAGTLVRRPSLTVKVKLSIPLKFSAGVYVNSGGVPERVPWAGSVSMV